MSAGNRAMFADFVELFYTRRDPRSAFERHVAADYRQHNPNMASGRDAALRMLVPLFGSPGAQFDVKRTLVDGDLAVVHLHGRPDPATAGVAVADFYRLAGGKIVEHWDVIQPIPTSPPNPDAMF